MDPCRILSRRPKHKDVTWASKSSNTLGEVLAAMSSAGDNFIAVVFKT